jgi:Arc/MetJ-type ribon-helix-helix transcriptional regulator
MTTPTPPDSASASTRSRAATLHVDLGEDLKQAVRLAAERAGVKPSDWVRTQLSAAVAADAPAPAGEDPIRKSADRLRQTFTSALRPEELEPNRTHQLSLQGEDVDQLDRVVTAGGFRSRPAALRYVLRLQTDAQALGAFRQLSATVPALIDSNMALHSAIRLEAAFAEAAVTRAGSGEVGHRGAPVAGGSRLPTLNRELQDHLQAAARVIAALQPLLVRRA